MDGIGWGGMGSLIDFAIALFSGELPYLSMGDAHTQRKKSLIEGWIDCYLLLSLVHNTHQTTQYYYY